MGLKDLFKPKWQHSDPHVRTKAVTKLNDDALLTKIILNDLNENVRRAALKKLHEVVKYTNISKDFHWTKKHENFLKRVALQDRSEIVRIEAISGVNDIISDKKYEDSRSRRRYKDSKEDQDLLVDIARRDASRNVRLECMKHLRDQSALLDIAQEDDDTEVRKAAANLLRDEDSLKDIAEHGKHEDARIVVISNRRIDDKLLIHIACKDNNPTLREAAVKALRDLNHVRNLAQTSIHPEVRSAAESILSEQKILEEKTISAQKILAEKAISASGSGERWNAVRDLKDIDVLKKVAAKEKDRHVFELAVEKLAKYVKKTTDQTALIDIAKSDFIEVVRSAAIIKVEDKKLKNTLSIQLLQEAVDNFKKEEDIIRRMYLSDAIAQCSSEETINFLGEVMHIEATVYKNYGEYPRERLVKRYEEILGKKFSKKRFKNLYGSNCDDGGLLAALEDYEIRFGSGKANIEKESQSTKALSTDLINSIEKGHIEILRDLLDKGADVDSKTKEGYTALMTAAQEGHTAIVQLLLEKGADVNAKLKSGQNALITSAAIGHASTVKVLLDNGADVDSEFGDGETALMVASKEGHEKVVQILLDYGANVNAQRQNGWTALMIAAYRGRAEIAKLLLKKDADVNVKDEAGETPLIVALVGSNLQAVPILLDYNADVNSIDMKGNPALVLAAEIGATDTVKSLLAKRANFNAKDEYGNTALLSAIRYEHSNMVKVLLEKGADVNVKNNKGQTAMIIASNLYSSKHKTDIINTLKMYGVK